MDSRRTSPRGVLGKAPLDPLTPPLASPWMRPRSSTQEVWDCTACAHRCELIPGRLGRCRQRGIRSEKVPFFPFGEVHAITLDPIEKKPFFHFLPGTRTLSFGMAGCDLACSFCQNWFVSQVGRDPAAKSRPEAIEADELVAAALEAGVQSLSASFNEPLIAIEWLLEVFTQAKAKGLATAVVSNGHSTPEVVGALAPVLDAAKIDLKSSKDSDYRALGGSLAPVLETLAGLYEAGVWVEAVTVLIPGMHEVEETIPELSRELCRLSSTIPWHLHGFRPDYRRTDQPPTPAKTLRDAKELARDSGVRFVYLDLGPGISPQDLTTNCPRCEAEMIRRGPFRVDANHLTQGSCSGCGEAIPGVFR